MSVGIDYSVNFAECKKLVVLALRSGLVPCIESAPGIGKSALARQVAEELNLFYIDIRLSTIEPTELNGFASTYEKLLDDGSTVKVAGYLPMEIWPIEGTPIPVNKATGQPYKGWLINLDELRSASVETQAAAYRLLLDREVGNKKLHRNVYVMAATNGVEHNAVAFDAGTALQSRITWLKMRSDVVDWLDSAKAKNFDDRVISFINWKGQMALNNFNPDSSETNFGCERTWEKVSKLCKRVKTPEIPLELLPLIVGTVGQSLAVEFQAYTQVYCTLSSFDDVINNPTGVIVDASRPDISYAMVGRIESCLDAKLLPTYIDNLMIYLNRLPIEFQAMLFTAIIKKAPQLQATCPAVVTWISTKANYLSNARNVVGAQPVAQPATNSQDGDDF